MTTLPVGRKGRIGGANSHTKLFIKIEQIDERTQKARAISNIKLVEGFRHPTCSGALHVLGTASGELVELEYTSRREIVKNNEIH